VIVTVWQEELDQKITGAVSVEDTMDALLGMMGGDAK
jgi:hypothetical protein